MRTPPPALDGAPSNPPHAAPGRVAGLDALLTEAVALGASDLHLSVGRPPTVRLHGELVAVPLRERLHERQTR